MRKLLLLTTAALLAATPALADDGGGAAALFILVIGAVGLVFYFLPSLVGGHRNVNSGIALLLVNFFLGWTAVGWIVCMIWAVAGKTKEEDAFYRRAAAERR